MLSFHPQFLLAVSRARGEHAPTASCGTGAVNSGSANGRARRRGKRSAACARGPEGKQKRSACGALAAGPVCGGVALLTEEPTFLQPGKAAACRPAASLSTPGSLLTRSSDSAAWVESFPLSRGASGNGYGAALSSPGSGSASGASRGLRVATHVAAFLPIMFLNSQTLELCASGSDCSLCQNYRLNQLLGFTTGVTSGKSLPCFFLRFFSVRPLVFPDTGGHTSSLDNSCILLHRNCHISAKPPSKCKGTKNAVGAGLGAGTLHWLGCLKAVEAVCRHPIWVGLAAI